MNALLHAMNIGTLATWLSVAGFGTVGLFVPQWWTGELLTKPEESVLDQGDIEVTDVNPDAPASFPLETREESPTPPAMPRFAENEALPDIPDLPTPTPTPTRMPMPLAKSADSSARPVTRPKPSVTASGKSAPTDKTTNGNAGASGMSDAARLAAGHMPSPSYPPDARRKQQTGTVIVEFTVDSAGKVISAYAKSPSPWPLLNAEAVRAVRRWTFPSGKVMKLQKPIVFQLQ